MALTSRDPRTRVLIATFPQAQQQLAGILDHCPVDFACSFTEGADALRHCRYSHVIVGYLFADSHMFEFAELVRRAQPSAHVICVKAAGRTLGVDVRQGLDAALRTLGCEGFFDLTAGEMPGTFNVAFNEVLARFAAPAAQGSERETVVGRLRVAVQELR